MSRYFLRAGSFIVTIVLLALMVSGCSTVTTADMTPIPQRWATRTAVAKAAAQTTAHPSTPEPTPTPVPALPNGQEVTLQKSPVDCHERGLESVPAGEASVTNAPDGTNLCYRSRLSAGINSIRGFVSKYVKPFCYYEAESATWYFKVTDDANGEYSVGGESYYPTDDNRVTLVQDEEYWANLDNGETLKFSVHCLGDFYELPSKN